MMPNVHPVHCYYFSMAYNLITIYFRNIDDGNCPSSEERPCITLPFPCRFAATDANFPTNYRRFNGCCPRTEEAVEPYRGEERVQMRSEPGAPLSLKPLDDRLGEAALLNAAICPAVGARRGGPARDCLGQG